ncbi:longevity-assurance (LAG1) protein, putative [Plasmodium yoelii]|nr:longevity-assurance (LAG1) protein, putative [Plasmodium yoelii]CDU18783.1 longevity-assurance (LAG1) protein, putative [Plasmodium yoelii]VTZ79368.1 longevity-assurance (LAG1) protein, putative [Plasmodium yoelii]|eukprot:XP_022812356.1 longevity-assurance (LAG1) protein, putative [Plasmodium yoelii]
MKLDTIFKILLLITIIFTIQEIWPLYELLKQIRDGSILFFIKEQFHKLYTFFCLYNLKTDINIFSTNINVSPNPRYFVFFVLSGCITFIVKYILNQISTLIGERLIPKRKWSPYIRGIKLGRFNVMFFNLIYFSLISIFGFISLKDQIYFPTEMGGQGNTSAYFLDYPNQKTSNLIHIYYFLNGGYLLTSVYSLLKSEKLPDFYENFLQHFCAMILVYFSYSHNLIRVGAIIMLCHDICEIFSSACRVFVDTRYKFITVSSFCILFLSWGYLRLYIFAKNCILPIHKNYNVFNSLIRVETFIWLIFLLLVILLMNVYWFVLMAKMFIHFITSGQTEDILTRVTEIEEKEKIIEMKNK